LTARPDAEGLEAFVAAGRLAPADATAAVDLRDALLRLLAQLAPGQRAVLVLTMYERRPGR
jgi:DNA-directed RNA polymerase specialized sigma24 family protein